MVADAAQFDPGKPRRKYYRASGNHSLPVWRSRARLKTIEKSIATMKLRGGQWGRLNEKLFKSNKMYQELIGFTLKSDKFIYAIVCLTLFNFISLK